MFISVSGMVGSGKTTIANHLVRLASSRGAHATCLGFQTLPCFSILRSSRRGDRREDRAVPESAADSAPLRWIGYKRKRLTATATLAYLTRIIAFQIYRRCWSSQRVYVLNRYFYDVFAHYDLNTPSERFYYSVLRTIMPVPDLAIVALAAPEIIAKRRPNYSNEYLAEVGRAYDALRERFPELIELRTDPGEPTFEGLEIIAVSRIAR
jgi:thymidylate kinase